MAKAAQEAAPALRLILSTSPPNPQTFSLSHQPWWIPGFFLLFRKGRSRKFRVDAVPFPVLSLTRWIRSTGTQHTSGSGGGEDGWREKSFRAGLQESAHSSAESSTLGAAVGSTRAGITGGPAGWPPEQQLLPRRLQKDARWGKTNLLELLTKIILCGYKISINLFF